MLHYPEGEGFNRHSYRGHSTN